MRINKSIIQKAGQSFTEKIVAPPMQITKNKSLNEQYINNIKLNESMVAPLYIFDERTIAIRYIGDEDIIEEYAGIEATAKLNNGDNIEIFIPKSAMDLLCLVWEITE